MPCHYGASGDDWNWPWRPPLVEARPGRRLLTGRSNFRLCLLAKALPPDSQEIAAPTMGAGGWWRPPAFN